MHRQGESTWQGNPGCWYPDRGAPQFTSLSSSGSRVPIFVPIQGWGAQQRPLALTGDSLNASCSICRTRLTCRVSTETPQHHLNCGTDRNVV